MIRLVFVTVTDEYFFPEDRHLVESLERFQPQVEALLPLLRPPASRLAPCGITG